MFPRQQTLHPAGEGKESLNHEEDSSETNKQTGNVMVHAPDPLKKPIKCQFSLSAGRKFPQTGVAYFFSIPSPTSFFFLIKIFAWGRKQRISLWAGITTCSQKRVAVGERARRDIERHWLVWSLARDQNEPCLSLVKFRSYSRPPELRESESGL